MLQIDGWVLQAFVFSVLKDLGRAKEKLWDDQFNWSICKQTLWNCIEKNELAILIGICDNVDGSCSFSQTQQRWSIYLRSQYWFFFGKRHNV